MEDVMIYDSADSDYNYTDYIPIPFAEKAMVLSPITLVALVIYSLVFLVGVMGNGMVIWVVGFQMKSSINTVWFLNLSVADLLCCLALPFLAVPLARDHQWELGDFACKLLPSLTILNMFASVLLLTLISIDRCALVLRPIWCQNHRSPRLAWAMCGVAWVSALLLTLPSFITRHTRSYQGSNWTLCEVNYTSHAAEVAVSMARFLLGFLIPFMVISICYALLVSRIHNSRFTRSKKTLKVVLVVVVGFFICWAPYHIVGLILANETPQSQLYMVVHGVDPLAAALAFLNSCINPIIYVIMGHDFKAKMRRSLKAIIRNVLSEDAMMASSVARGRTQADGAVTTTTTSSPEDRSACTSL